MIPITSIQNTKVKYPVVHGGIAKSGIKISNDSDSSFVWYDGFTTPAELENIQPNQRCNRIPKMDQICTKIGFQRCMQKAKLFNAPIFSFFPPTFLLPKQFTEFYNTHTTISNKAPKKTITWISKPKSGCSGNGIELCQNPSSLANLTHSCIVQLYIEPFLMNDYKFDFRLYIFISCLKPYTVYLYNEGIARFCTSKYQVPSRANLDCKFIHLTNTAINVHNMLAQNNYTQLASEVLKRLEPSVWNKIQSVAALSMLGIFPDIIAALTEFEETKKVHEHVSFRTQAANSKMRVVHGISPLKRYTHLIGIDVLIDSNQNPIVLEINDRPSLSVTFSIEKSLKESLVEDIIHILQNDNPSLEVDSIPNWTRIIPNSSLPRVERCKDHFVEKVVAKAGQLIKNDSSKIVAVLPRLTSHTLEPFDQ